MKSINYNGKKTTYNICIILVLWTLGAHAATLPPDPDNAALLYYQAFLLRPESDSDTSASIDEVLRGGAPDEKLRKYLNLADVRETIELADAAAQIPQCNWGIRYSQGTWVPSQLLINFRLLSFLVYADASALIADGDYRAALGRCLTMRRIAGHVGDDELLIYVVSLQLDGLAHRCTQDVLGSMPLDADILTWLRGQLIAVRDVIPSFVRALEMNLELSVQSLRTNPEDLVWLREQLTENADSENTRDEILSLTDEEIIALFRDKYVDFNNSIFYVIDSEMTYEEKSLEIQRLGNIMHNECAAYNTEQIDDYYNLKVRNTAQFNALKAAIEIYLIKAKTGQLPEILPDGLPKDPYSGQDFGYEITEKGFTFHSRGEDFQGNGGQLLEFKVQQ